MPRAPKAARARVTTQEAGTNRRQDRRIPLSLDVAVPVLVRGFNGLQRGLARNVSERGMFLEVREPPPIGTEIEVTFAGPALTDALVLCGEVRHHVAWQVGGHRGLKGVGIRFLDKLEQVAVTHSGTYH